MVLPETPEKVLVGLGAVTVFLVVNKSHMLELLAFDEKSTFDLFALFPHTARII
jgi:hypothetical protein